MSKEKTNPLPKSRPYEDGKKDIQLNYIVKEIVPDNVNVNICDFGCGNGLFLAALENYPNKKIGIYLPVDDDELALKETMSHMYNNLQMSSPELASYKSNDIDWNKYEKVFDFVIMHHVFHELDTYKVLNIIFKILKPDGKLIIGDMIFFRWYEHNHVFWDCSTIQELFYGEKFDICCITHKDQDEYESYLAVVSLKEGISFPEMDELRPKLRRIYQKMLEYCQKRISEKDGPHRVKPITVGIYESLVVHIMSRLTELDDIPPFDLVDEGFLKENRAKEKQEYTFRPPQWSDVVHGEDDKIKYIERDQTQGLKTEVLSHLVEPIKRGTDRRLHCLFVVGPPFTGKSTIVRRVASLLVEEGLVIVADAGTAMGDPKDEVVHYRNCLQRATENGLPVLLLLDDPLRENSGWVDLLRSISHPNIASKLCVLAATPKFLYDRFHKDLLLIANVKAFSINSLSDSERERLARFYEYGGLTTSKMNDDFMLKIEASESGDVDGFFDKLWNTMNDGRAPKADRFTDFPWQVRAFYIICFFQRFYVPCPELLLHAFLNTEAGDDSYQASSSLNYLKHERGWQIFQISDTGRSNWAYSGQLISLAHPILASRAWERRPLPFFDIESTIIQASARVPETARYMANLASMIAMTSNTEDEHRFLKNMIETWLEVAKQGNMEIRHLAELCAILSTNKYSKFCKPLIGYLKSKAKSTRDGWLAAQTIWLLSAANDKERYLPAEIDIKAIINSADFSIAPNRAVKFGDKICRGSYRAAFVERLLKSLVGELDWELSPYLLTKLIEYAPPNELVSHISELHRWLEEHPDATDVKTKYLDFIIRELPFSRENENLYDSTATGIASYLDEHPEFPLEIGDIRVKYLKSLAELYEHFERDMREVGKALPDWLISLCDHAAAETGGLLERYPDANHIRTQYLPFLSTIKHTSLPQLIEKTLELLKKTNPDNCSADVTSALLKIVTKHGSVDDVSRVLEWTSDHIGRRGCLRTDKLFVDSMQQPYERLSWEANESSNPEDIQRILLKTKECIQIWHEMNPRANAPKIA